MLNLCHPFFLIATFWNWSDLEFYLYTCFMLRNEIIIRESGKSMTMFEVISDILCFDKSLSNEKFLTSKKRHKIKIHIEVQIVDCTRCDHNFDLLPKKSFCWWQFPVGYSHVGDIVMLVTIFRVVATELRSWWHLLNIDAKR